MSKKLLIGLVFLTLVGCGKEDIPPSNQSQEVPSSAGSVVTAATSAAPVSAADPNPIAGSFYDPKPKEVAAYVEDERKELKKCASEIFNINNNSPSNYTGNEEACKETVQFPGIRRSNDAPIAIGENPKYDDAEREWYNSHPALTKLYAVCSSAIAHSNGAISVFNQERDGKQISDGQGLPTIESVIPEIQECTNSLNNIQSPEKQQSKISSHDNSSVAQNNSFSIVQIVHQDADTNVEEAMVTIIKCQGIQSTRNIYQYHRNFGPNFRAIAPPDWGNPLGGHDFSTFDQAVGAACGDGA